MSGGIAKGCERLVVQEEGRDLKGDDRVQGSFESFCDIRALYIYFHWGRENKKGCRFLVSYALEILVVCLFMASWV
jgi:hypothetical protein